MKQYVVPQHVYFCFTGDHCVFLDLHRDRYFCMERAQLTGMESRVHCWPQLPAPPAPTPEEPAPAQQIEKTAREMFEHGLLTVDQSREQQAIRPAITTAIVTASSALLTQLETETRPRVTATDALNFFLAASLAYYRLRRWSTERTVRFIEARKRQAQQRGVQSDWQAAPARVAAFTHLRGLFPKNALCLFDSLALLEFLARYELYPDWVFGVRTEPFFAHCWVQRENTLFNETFDYVRPYTPIMAI